MFSLKHQSMPGTWRLSNKGSFSVYTGLPIVWTSQHTAWGQWRFSSESAAALTDHPEFRDVHIQHSQSWPLTFSPNTKKRPTFSNIGGCTLKAKARQSTNGKIRMIQTRVNLQCWEEQQNSKSPPNWQIIPKSLLDFKYLFLWL